MKKADENATLMNGVETTGPARDDVPETFGQFLYNKKNGTVLGRNGKSWFQIIVFYIIFYALLAAFWLACLTIFLKTLDPKVPRFYGKGTIIGVNPGVGYQPWLKERPDSTLIQYNLQDQSTWKPYVDQMKTYLDKYDSNATETRECGAGDSNDDLEKNPDALPCRFDLNVFEKGCSEKSEYGFKSGKPCVIISLNRLIGWRPTDFPANSVPEEVKDRYKTGSIAINCQGATNVDKEHIGKVTYMPPNGIDGRFYPYVFTKVRSWFLFLGQAAFWKEKNLFPFHFYGYQQPIAMVKFDTIPRNKLVIVECRAYALNIEHDISSRLGMVYFEVMVEDKKVEAKKEL
ncbi:hypothetical protein CAEBREN_23157 [Caenorhabditis brenneri]|uniref:Sodium/potassium-transporting ATPase subunit beta n=1 Tax=Caenorhabditis brenneri TaxID=135651 RepID=G0MEZ5_CAEBE|nr:hypothetical protein CAEBREN_23157 [Caenorhabditis brenneri]